VNSVYRVEVPIMEILEKEDTDILFIALRLVNVPGVMKQVASILAEYNVNILSGIIYGPSDSPESLWIFSADFTNSKASPEVILDKIRKLDVVLSCEYGVKKMGKMLFPPYFIELNILGMGAIIERRRWLQEVNKVILEEFGSGAEALFFHVGFRAGYRIVEYWTEASGLKGKNLIVLALEVMKGLNWISDYSVERIDLIKPDILFRVWNLMDCSPFKGKEKRATSQYFRGILSGFISRIIGKHVVLKETKCIAKGDPYCEFSTGI